HPDKREQTIVCPNPQGTGCSPHVGTCRGKWVTWIFSSSGTSGKTNSKGK
ncbi:hypothetical protein NDU88_004440, partial [Pleurodeles waltl]